MFQRSPPAWKEALERTGRAATRSLDADPDEDPRVEYELGDPVG